MFKKTILIIIVILFTTTLTFAQAEKVKAVPFSIGLYAGLNMNMHSPSFNYMNQVKFDNNATGLGAVLGFTGMYSINDIFVISGKLGYNGMGGMLTNTDIDLDASINYIEFSPELQFHNLIPIKNSYLIAGLESGIPLSPRYTLTGDTSLNIDNESIPDASFRVAAIFGLGYFLASARRGTANPAPSFTASESQTRTPSYAVCSWCMS